MLIRHYLNNYLSNWWLSRSNPNWKWQTREIGLVVGNFNYRDRLCYYPKKSLKVHDLFWLRSFVKFIVFLKVSDVWPSNHIKRHLQSAIQSFAAMPIFSRNFKSYSLIFLLCLNCLSNFFYKLHHSKHFRLCKVEHCFSHFQLFIRPFKVLK